MATESYYVGCREGLGPFTRESKGSGLIDDSKAATDAEFTLGHLTNVVSVFIALLILIGLHGVSTNLGIFCQLIEWFT
jgi:hypothetical protein